MIRQLARVSRSRLQLSATAIFLFQPRRDVLVEFGKLSITQSRRYSLHTSLTSSRPRRSGAVYRQQRVPVLGGFETQFEFQVSDHSRSCTEVRDRNFNIYHHKVRHTAACLRGLGDREGMHGHAWAPTCLLPEPGQRVTLHTQNIMCVLPLPTGLVHSPWYASLGVTTCAWVGYWSFPHC